MIERFQGDNGRRALVAMLARSYIVEGNQDLAGLLAEQGHLREYASGDVMIAEGAIDASVYLIVAGSFDVFVKGNKVATRGPSEIVGETGAIDPAQPRSATLTATAASVAVEVADTVFHKIAEKFPSIWRALAVDLARRLVQRNALVSKVNEEVNVFIICSVEALPVAQELQLALSHEKMLVTLWTNGVFTASHYAVESLEAALDVADFAIAIAHPDDETTVREKTSKTPRDNVIFELGFFMGRLSRKRTLLLEPRGEDIKLPSDLSGMNVIGYRPGPPERLAALISPAATEIKKIVRALGPR